MVNPATAGIDMFDWVSLYTNVGKTVSIACQPCHTIRGYYTEAYGLRIMGEGLTY